MASVAPCILVVLNFFSFDSTCRVVRLVIIYTDRHKNDHSEMFKKVSLIQLNNIKLKNYLLVMQN